MAPLHLHPRATEVFLLVNGTVHTEMVPESGVLTADGDQRVIRTQLKPGQMTVFPAGSFHAQVNTECEPVFAVAAFSAEDPGAGAVVPGALAFSDEFAGPAFGIKGEDVDSYRERIPEGAAGVVEECLAKCGLEKRQY